VTRLDLTAWEEAEQTHVEYVPVLGGFSTCHTCDDLWPCLTALLIADPAIHARADRYEKALREILGSLVEDDCWCHDEGMSGDACVPCIARAALAEDES